MLSTTAQMEPSVYIRSSINKMNPMLKRLLPSTLLIASWGALILNAANEAASSGKDVLKARN